MRLLPVLCAPESEEAAAEGSEGQLVLSDDAAQQAGPERQVVLDFQEM